jgi:hypothetical protein
LNNCISFWWNDTPGEHRAMAADSVIVAFPQMAKGADADRAVVEYLEHRHVAGCAERDDQFTDERA